MPRLTKQETADFDAHLNWRAWGEQFGWRLQGSNGVYSAEFRLPQGDKIYVVQAARMDIDRAILKAKR